VSTAIGTYVTPAEVKLAEGITDTNDDANLAVICDGVNQYIESATQRVMAPISSATYLYDGGEPKLALEPYLPPRRTKLWLPITADGVRLGGLRAVTLVEIAAYTGQAYTTIPSNEYFLRGSSMPGAPFDWLQLSDYATIYRYFPPGYATVRVTGTAGWAVIPDDLASVARDTAIRAFHAFPTGSADADGTSNAPMVHSAPNIAQFVTARQNAILRAYSLVDNLV